MNALISIIVPVYNVEYYLPRCIESIQKQTYQNLQIILVNDGSTDSSGKICDRLAEKDNRLTVLHKENGGLSSARNYGLAYAKGEFIAFVDSDDYIHPNMYEHMMHVVNTTDVDMVICDFQEVYEDTTSYKSISFENLCCAEPDIVENEDILVQLRTRDVQTVVQWNKLYKKRIFDHIWYPEGRLHEDVFIIHRELWECEKIAYLTNKYYYYVQRNSSIMHAETKRNFQDAIKGFEERIAFYEERACQKGADQAAEMLLMYILWKYDSTNKEQKDIRKFLGLELKSHYMNYKDRDINLDEYKLPASNLFLYEISKKIKKVQRKFKDNRGKLCKKN